MGFQFESPIPQSLISKADACLGASGDIWFVALDGDDDNNTGTSWDNAFRTIIHAVGVAGDGDTIIIGQGIYNEDANGAAGVVITQERLSIIGVGTKEPFPVITNQNTDNNGSVLTFAATATFSAIFGVVFQKGETTGNNTIIVKCDGTFGAVIDNCSIQIEKNDATGLQFTNGALTCWYKSIGLRATGGVPSGNIGVDFDDCTACFVSGNISIGLNLAVGARFGAATTVNFLDNTNVTNCVVGAQIDAGATGNVINASFTNCGTPIVDNSGNATNYRWGSITHLHDDIAFIRPHPGNIWVVDGTNGLDTNSGHSPNEPLQTIGAAVTAASPGDAIVIRPDTYDEAVNLNKAGLQLWPELGVILTNTTPGIPLTLSANNCVIKRGGLIVSQIGQVGVHVTGQACRLEEIIVTAATIGIDIDATATIILRTNISGHTVTGIDIDSGGCILEDAQIVGSGGATRGFYLSSSSADGNILNRCISGGNATAGFEAIATTTGNIFKDSSSGEGDGSPIDGGLNSWPNFQWIDGTEEHEDLWPIFLGQGVAADPVTINNDATDDTPDSRDDQNYWGDTVAIIAPNAITQRWLINGVEVFAGTANKRMVYEFYYPQSTFSTTRNGGNAWDLGETALTVQDGTIIQNGDKIWITSTSDPNGEILLVTNVAGNVVTIASETRASGNTGIRYNHVGSETMYVIERSGLNRLDGHQAAYAAASTKASTTRKWRQKDLPPNTAMIGRLANIDDDLTASIDVKVIYGD